MQARTSQKGSIIKRLSLVTLSITLGACSALESKRQTDILHDAAAITGRVEQQSPKKGLTYVIVYRQAEGFLEAVYRQPISSGKFDVPALPNTYFIGAFIDSDGDGKYTEGEHATYYGIENNNPTPFTIAESETFSVPTLVIDGPITQKTGQKIEVGFGLIQKNIGRVVSLEEPMFSRDNTGMGLWRPFDYADQYGGGLMMLQDYEKGKTPVVFVHGILGTALDFSDMIPSINREKFQPWVLQYPSGVALDMVSDYMKNALIELHSRYQFKEVIVVAHSMGGLMTRSFVMKHQASEQPYALKMVMTINSPLHGMDSARTGVNTSPIVVPAWEDVATDSDYVQRVHAWNWPDTVPYHLMFSYLPDEEGDGVVPMKSQLTLKLQDEAVGIMGFQGQHAGVLHEEIFVERFNSVLNQYTK